jgi:hypothetical protein
MKYTGESWDLPRVRAASSSCLYLYWEAFLYKLSTICSLPVKNKTSSARHYLVIVLGINFKKRIPNKTTTRYQSTSGHHYFMHWMHRQVSISFFHIPSPVPGAVSCRLWNVTFVLKHFRKYQLSVYLRSPEIPDNPTDRENNWAACQFETAKVVTGIRITAEECLLPNFRSLASRYHQQLIRIMVYHLNLLLKAKEYPYFIIARIPLWPPRNEAAQQMQYQSMTNLLRRVG